MIKKIYYNEFFCVKSMDSSQIIELGVGASIIAAGVILWAYIKKIKNKLKKFVLRGGQ